MLKKLFILSIVSLFILSTVGAYAETALNQPIAKPPIEKTKDRASRAMNNIFYGPVEVPKNLDETKTKGVPVDRCTQKTRTGVERGIARVVGGIWQLATFWYSDPGCVTSSNKAAQTAAAPMAAPTKAAEPMQQAPAQTAPDVK